MLNMKAPHSPPLTCRTLSRCLGDEDLLKDASVKELASDVIKRAQEKYTFRLTSCTIGDNHLLLEIQTDQEGPSISQIVQWIKARIATGYNKGMNRTGPFWNGRNRHTIIESRYDSRQVLWEAKGLLASGV